jgi:hypothetical protein
MSLPPNGPFIPHQPKKTNTLALVGFLVSISCCSPVGLILSIIGLNQIDKNQNEGGRGLAIAGIVISTIGVFIGFIYIVGLAASGSGY